jgi:hypothetical protein
LDWDSLYDFNEKKKRPRVLSKDTDLRLPKWVAYLRETHQQNLQTRAKTSLANALQVKSVRNGIGICKGEYNDSPWICTNDGCNTEIGSENALLAHMESFHNMEAHSLAQLRWGFLSREVREHVRKRRAKGIMASGRRWPWPSNMPVMKDKETVLFQPRNTMI